MNAKVFLMTFVFGCFTICLSLLWRKEVTKKHMRENSLALQVELKQHAQSLL